MIGFAIYVNRLKSVCWQVYYGQPIFNLLLARAAVSDGMLADKNIVGYPVETGDSIYYAWNSIRFDS